MTVENPIWIFSWLSEVVDSELIIYDWRLTYVYLGKINTVSKTQLIHFSFRNKLYMINITWRSPPSAWVPAVLMISIHKSRERLHRMRILHFFIITIQKSNWILILSKPQNSDSQTGLVEMSDLSRCYILLSPRYQIHHSDERFDLGISSLNRTLLEQMPSQEYCFN